MSQKLDGHYDIEEMGLILDAKGQRSFHEARKWVSIMHQLSPIITRYVLTHRTNGGEHDHCDAGVNEQFLNVCL